MAPPIRLILSIRCYIEPATNSATLNGETISKLLDPLILLIRCSYRRPKRLDKVGQNVAAEVKMGGLIIEYLGQ